MDDKKKILIVDDEADLLDVLGKRLTTEGYSVITADNGINGISLAKSECPDLLILDVMMPKMGGEEVAEKLKENPTTKDIPIIFLTALVSRAEEEKRNHFIGKHVFVAKPYDKDRLLTVISKLLTK
jgi:CheY-like chemotaxis protein